MSCQKGNVSRSRAPKFQNRTAFKNDLHDKTHKTKLINSIEVANVCERCKQKIEWKIKYKKYKPLKVPVKCTKCEQKVVKHAYHIMCLPCAKQREICPKCGISGKIIAPGPSKEEQMKLNAEFQALLKTLSERKRRKFLRDINQKAKDKKSNGEDISGLSANTNEDTTFTKNKDLLEKLKLLAIAEDKNDNFDSDIDDISDDSFE